MIGADLGAEHAANVAGLPTSPPTEEPYFVNGLRNLTPSEIHSVRRTTLSALPSENPEDDKKLFVVPDDDLLSKR